MAQPSIHTIRLRGPWRLLFLPNLPLDRLADLALSPSNEGPQTRGLPGDYQKIVLPTSSATFCSAPAQGESGTEPTATKPVTTRAETTTTPLSPKSAGNKKNSKGLYWPTDHFLLLRRSFHRPTHLGEGVVKIDLETSFPLLEGILAAPSPFFFFKKEGKKYDSPARGKQSHESGKISLSAEVTGHLGDRNEIILFFERPTPFRLTDLRQPPRAPLLSEGKKGPTKRSPDSFLEVYLRILAD
ncbi:MAG: hypothetical protein MPJ24_09910 [Pirellulaceae bacterium]|nr:hypothetical protein [Pirellulaceae bacterium]